MDYLDSLKSLEDNWISGKAQSPTHSVIEIGKHILSEFNLYVERNFINKLPSYKSEIGEYTQFPSTDVYTRYPKIPKVIMGPISTGGICLEFHADKSTALFVTIRNNAEKMDLEVKIKDYYSDFTLPNKNYRDLVNEYAALSWN